MMSNSLSEGAESVAVVSRYAGLGRRFAAACLDNTLVTSFTMLCIWAALRGGGVAFVLWIPLSMAGAAYELLFLAARGQTVGKMAMGIRVVKLSGDPLGWREALLRTSVGIALALGAGVASLIALTHLAPSAWGAGAYEVVREIETLQPAWGRALSTVTQIWAWSELVVMLFNKRRRALHDFMAGTIVIRDPR